MLLFCVEALVYTHGCKRVGQVNPVAKFLGGICFEIYLCHMVIYRVLEKLHLIHLFENALSSTTSAHSGISETKQQLP